VKHSYLLTLLFLPACKLPHRQQFALDARVAVELPGRPYSLNPSKVKAVKHPEHMKIWFLRTLGGSYQLLRSVNPAMHITAQDTMGRAARYARAEATLRKEHAQDIVARPFTVAGMEGRDFTYKSFRRSTQELESRYMRSLLVDSVSYVLLFVPTSQTGILGFAGENQQLRFFNSITVKP
jgi:hypothetical protein